MSERSAKNPSARNPSETFGPGRVSVGWRRRAAGTLDGAVVETVSITVAVVVVELKVTLVGETPQALSLGKLRHCGAKLNVPVSPFMAVSVRDVLPDCPGFVMDIKAGFAAIEKSGETVTVTAVLPEEPV